MQKIITLALVLCAAGGAGAYLVLASGSGLGQAAPRPDVASTVAFDWMLADGQLLQGTTELKVPQGMNVALSIDNDRADTLQLGAYDIAFELPADSLVPVEFYTYKTGHYEIALKSSGRKLASLTVVPGR